jgi:gas vesicle protein
MGEETTRLKQEIHRTRQELTRDVDRLADRTSPARIVGRRVRSARAGLTTMKDRVMGSAGHPHMPERSPLESAKQATAQIAGSAKESVTEVGERAQEAVAEVRQEVREQTEGNPLAAGVIAFGVGWLASSLLPAGRAGSELAQRAGDLAKERVGPAVGQAKQVAQEATQEIGQEMRQPVREAAEQVKERAQEATGTVREQAGSPPPR